MPTTKVLPRALCIVTVAALLLPRAARAEAPGGEQLYAPSIFIYGFNGFLLGAGTGVGAGYLAARAGGWNRDDWQPLLYGATIGALAGGGLGLGLGITDMVNETHGRGYFVLRDGGYGLGFGVATGAIIGGLTAIASRKPERIAAGGAIGGLFGTAGGLVLGIIEGQRAWRRHTNVAVTVAPVAEVSGALTFVPALVGRY
jgi:hypothetical protein